MSNTIKRLSKIAIFAIMFGFVANFASVSGALAYSPKLFDAQTCSPEEKDGCTHDLGVNVGQVGILFGISFRTSDGRTSNPSPNGRCSLVVIPQNNFFLKLWMSGASRYEVYDVDTSDYNGWLKVLATQRADEQEIHYGCPHKSFEQIEQWGTGSPSPVPSQGPAPSAPPSTGNSRTFPETGHTVKGRFLDYWNAHGGLAINGFPLTDERMETLENGQQYLVQWFERTRMEYHPENQAPYDVLLGQYGRRIAGMRGVNTAPAQQRQDSRYFSETGHNLRGTFQSYWQANGGLAQFGFPITEEITETLENGKVYTVQYFERARFQDTPGYGVELGLFGTILLNGGQQPASSPAPAPSNQPTASCTTPRQLTGDGKELPFKAGDCVEGVDIMLDNGQTKHNCYYLSAPSSGRVKTGVIGPYDGERAKSKPCQ